MPLCNLENINLNENMNNEKMNNQCIYLTVSIKFIIFVENALPIFFFYLCNLCPVNILSKFFNNLNLPLTFISSFHFTSWYKVKLDIVGPAEVHLAYLCPSTSPIILWPSMTRPINFLSWKKEHYIEYCATSLAPLAWCLVICLYGI